MIKKIAPFSPTKEQRKWVDDECKKSKESQATVMRKLIQERIDRAKPIYPDLIISPYKDAIDNIDFKPLGKVNVKSFTHEIK